jgi:UDP-N-acetylmuramoyl-tripeptide--D-alanyl-D-alanine ligase
MILFDVEDVRAITGGRWLAQPAARSITGVGSDTRAPLAGAAFVAIKGRRHDGHDHLAGAARAGAVIAIVERATSPRSIPPGLGVLHVRCTRRALADLARAHRSRLGGTVIGVTGSFGKTTTKALIGAVLGQGMTGTAAPKSFNNEIGLPLTVLAAAPADAFVLLEIGTNSPGEIAALSAIARPDLAVITGAGRAHLGGFGSARAIAEEKAAILDHAAPGATAFVATGSADLDAAIAERGRAGGAPPRRIVRYGEGPEAALRLTAWGGAGEVWWLEVDGAARFEIALPGRHNAVNALAAIAVGRAMGLGDEAIAAGLRAAALPPMRMARSEHGGIAVVNDAYNANPEAMAAALETFAILAADRRRVLLLGDMLELGAESAPAHRELGERIALLHARCPLARVVLVGAHVAETREALARAGLGAIARHVPVLDDGEARAIATALRPGDAVLLKGSRGMALERVADAVARRSAGATEGAASAPFAVGAPS